MSSRGKCAVEKLSALVDGDLSERAARKLRAHVDGCASCARALGDLETMKRGLGALPARVGEDNWSLVVNRLAQPLAPAPRRFLPALSWRFALPSLALLALVAGGGAWLRWHKGRGLSADAVIAHAESEFHKADEHYRRAVDELRSVAEKERKSWAVPKRAEYDAAQAQLEAAVTRCHQVADSQPADVDAEELLFAAYRKEIRFFEDQMMREAQ
jgi:anti-sigma factor RsiW